MSKPPRGKLGKNASGDHDPKQCNHKVNGQFIHYKPNKAYEGKPLVETYDADGKRMLIVPSRDPIDRPVILGRTEFNRLKQQAHVVTLQDRMKMIEEAEKKKNQLLYDSQARKDMLLKTQKLPKRSLVTKEDSVESEAANKNLFLLRRSQELMMERDDRVKAANKVILATKCKAIRNAQIAEKQLIEHHLKEEDRRLDMMMEQQRQKLVEIEEKKREEDEKKKKRYVTEVTQQVKEQEILRLLEAEKIEEESRMLNKALIALQKEEEEKLKRKKEMQLKMREEFRKANAEAEQYKNLRNEEQRIADLRVQEFMRQKAEREEVREKEMALARAAKEMEIARLRALQEKSKDIQAALDEIHALRSREEKEREWREKEKNEAIMRKKRNETLRAARQQQIDDIRKAQAAALARDEEDFRKVAKVQRELFEKDKEEQKKKREQIEKHRVELLKQINEKERERIKWMQERFEDGNAQRLELKVKDKSVENYLKHKIHQLKENNVPERYIHDIERQLKVIK